MKPTNIMDNTSSHDGSPYDNNSDDGDRTIRGAPSPGRSQPYAQNTTLVLRRPTRTPGKPHHPNHPPLHKIKLFLLQAGEQDDDSFPFETDPITDVTLRPWSATRTLVNDYTRSERSATTTASGGIYNITITHEEPSVLFELLEFW
jgi:hypothetical protein